MTSLQLERWITSLPWKEFPGVPFSTIRITENAYPPETIEAIERYRGALQQENEKIQAILRLALLCKGVTLREIRQTTPGAKFSLLMLRIIKEIGYPRCSDACNAFPWQTMEDIRLFEGSCLDPCPSGGYRWS